MFKRRVKLPTTLKEYDDLVDKVVKKFKLADLHHASSIISVAIRHLPNTAAYTTIDYLGEYVQKNIANFIADHKSNLLKHAAQIRHLADLLRSDPGNTQARDELQKAANDGSEPAKEALAKLEEEYKPRASA